MLLNHSGPRAGPPIERDGKHAEVWRLHAGAVLLQSPDDGAAGEGQLAGQGRPPRRPRRAAHYVGATAPGLGAEGLGSEEAGTPQSASLFAAASFHVSITI